MINPSSSPSSPVTFASLVLCLLFVSLSHGQSEEQVPVDPSNKVDAVACAGKGGFVITQLGGGDRGEYVERCFFPILSDIFSLRDAGAECMSAGGKLAPLKKSEPVFDEFIRRSPDFNTHAAMWIDGTYMKDGNVQYSDSSTVNLEKSWRFLYPMKGKFRTGIVYSVWAKRISENEYLKGFKNISPKAKYHVLCQL